MCHMSGPREGEEEVLYLPVNTLVLAAFRLSALASAIRRNGCDFVVGTLHLTS